MYSVLIADDEPNILTGLKYIIDWGAYGFKIEYEATNGLDALDLILNKMPNLVMLDVKMPKMSGIDIVKTARKAGYKGRIIILSGYTDFEFTQAAVEFNVDYYFAKPVDEDDLADAVKKIASQFRRQDRLSDTYNCYREKAKGIILKDILLNRADFTEIDLDDINLNSDVYQVVIYEQYSHNDKKLTFKFSDLLNLANQKSRSYDTITIDDNEIILLKGPYTLHKFKEFLSRYDDIDMRPEKDSPLDSLFIAYGSEVFDIRDVHKSYEEAQQLLKRRFFCSPDQHTIGSSELPSKSQSDNMKVTPALLKNYCESFVNVLQTGKKNQIKPLLDNLHKDLFYSTYDVGRIKLFLTDLFLSVKEKIAHLYQNTDLSFMKNADIIDFISKKYYLYEIMTYFQDQFETILNAIGNPSSDDVIENVIIYIRHNYMHDIKLENLAPMFGYNSSYLGKIFTKKMKITFNSFVDNVRIDKAKSLLERSNLKVYEIADRVGYHNVDYFHTKFKRYVNMSPAEYRKLNKKDSASH